MSSIVYMKSFKAWAVTASRAIEPSIIKFGIKIGAKIIKIKKPTLLRSMLLILLDDILFALLLGLLSLRKLMDPYNADFGMKQ